MVDYVVDEGVQIFGGYGFHEDYPVARAYRDSRVNRIFEGTNEINRMLIIQMLMKRAMGGLLPLIPAAMKLGEEVLAGPSFEEAPTGPFAEEEKSLEQAKKIFLLASGTAMQNSASNWRAAGNRGVAGEYRDGGVRDGIVAAARAEGFSGARRSCRGDVRGDTRDR